MWTDVYGEAASRGLIVVGGGTPVNTHHLFKSPHAGRTNSF